MGYRRARAKTRVELRAMDDELADLYDAAGGLALDFHRFRSIGRLSAAIGRMTRSRP